TSEVLQAVIAGRQKLPYFFLFYTSPRPRDRLIYFVCRLLLEKKKKKKKQKEKKNGDKRKLN
ncbi:hypothetical protein, partial [Sphingobacterium daejeonense]|uniref:hypothetical protein n=1 Tax=Sphingobacterium daejeonense TaxID=371142 RepID=UPI003D310F37